MGYYTDALDSVAPKGGHVVLGSQIDTLYLERMNLFGQILKNEKNNLSKTKAGRDANDIKRNIEKLEFLIKEEQADYADGHEDYLNTLVQEEFNRFDYCGAKALSKKTKLQTELNELNTRKESKGLIGKILHSFKKEKELPSREELTMAIENEDKISKLYFDTLRNEFRKLKTSEQQYYSFVSAMKIMERMKMLYPSETVSYKDLTYFERFGILEGLMSSNLEKLRTNYNLPDAQ